MTGGLRSCMGTIGPELRSADHNVELLRNGCALPCVLRSILCAVWLRNIRSGGKFDRSSQIFLGEPQAG